MGAGSAERDVGSTPYGHKPDLRRTGRRIQKALTRNPRSPVDRSGGSVRRSSRLQRGLPTVSPQITDKRRGIGVPPPQNKQRTTSSSLPPRRGGPQATKRAHCEGDEHAASRQGDTPKQDPPIHTKGAVGPSRQDQYIEHWLEAIHIPRKPPTSLHETVVDMPREAPSSVPTDMASTPEESGTKTTASVDALALHYRNIVIGKVPPPPGLEGRARQMISGVPTSGDMDRTALENLRQLLMREEGENESMLVTLLLPSLQALGLGATLDPRLRARPNQLWYNCVPIPLPREFQPLSSSVPPLPRPKPDVTFGFSLDAFTSSQQSTLGSLCEEKNPKQNYAIPDGQTVLPFLTFEFKAEANRGTHFVAKKQAANSGAVALNGGLQLMERSGLGPRGAFDRGVPQYFSITIEFASARVNLHWVEMPPGGGGGGGPHRFHASTLEIYPLIHVEGLLALFRAVRNILEWAVETRLPKLRAALDACHHRRKSPRRIDTKPHS